MIGTNALSLFRGNTNSPFLLGAKVAANLAPKPMSVNIFLLTLYQERKDMEKVNLTIRTDKGFTADFLRQLANVIEENEEDILGYTAIHGTAKLEYEE